MIFAAILTLASIAILIWAAFQNERKVLENASSSNIPIQIHLEEIERPNWVTEKDIEAFKSHGFEIGHSFTVCEMPELEIQTFFEASGLGAALGHQYFKKWAEICGYTEEIEITVSSTEDFHLDRPGYLKRVFLPNAAIGELVNRLKLELKGSPIFYPITKENFTKIFESEWERDMKWRIQKGGYSDKEFRAMLDPDSELSPEHEQEIIFNIRLKHWLGWGQEAVEVFRENNPKEKGVYFYFTNCIPRDILTNYLFKHRFFFHDQLFQYRAMAKELTTDQLFQKILEDVPPKVRPHQIQEIDFPVAGSIYSLSPKKTT